MTWMINTPVRLRRAIIAAVVVLAAGLWAALSVWAQAPESAERPTDQAEESRTPTAPAIPTTPAQNPAEAGASGAQPELPAADKPEKAATPVELPLEKRPYRVTITVAFGNHPSISPDFRRGVLDSIRNLADRTAGQLWELSVAESRTLRPADRSGLERLSSAGLRGNDPVALQQVFFVTVRVAGARYELAARRWDRITEQLGPIATSQTFDHRDVGVSVLRLVEELFRPLLAVDRLAAETGKLHLRLQAGALAAVDEDAGPLKRQIAPGDILAPLFRYLDKQGVAQKIQYLPWTYLVVESVDRSEVVCEVVSGIRAPVGKNRSKTVESLAVAIRASHPSTRFRVLPQIQPARPLVGHYVVVAPKKFARDEPMDDVLRLVTDRSGTVAVPADPARPMIWLYISSGANLLARVPFVPGVDREATIEVPDDSLRLQVEGEIAQLKGQLVDSVAKRFTLLGRAKVFAKEKDAARVEEQLKELDALPGIPDFQQQLNVIRVPAIEAAKQRNDRLGQRRIERLCDETADLIRRYLDPDKAQEVREQIQELRIDAGT